MPDPGSIALNVGQHPPTPLLCIPHKASYLHVFLPTYLNFQEPYATFPYSMMTIFVMTLGELNYADNFMPWGKLEYAILTNILFFLFVLGMPIILMNMLVSFTPQYRDCDRGRLRGRPERDG